MSAQKPLDLSADIAEARAILEPASIHLRGMFQLWNILTTANKMCEAFIRDFDNLSYEAKLAYTKGIIVDYFKPWSGNRSKALKKIINSRGEILFLNAILIKSNTHNALKELRNKMVAHIDEGYESLAVTLRGATIKNVLANRPQQPGTLNEVFIPFAVKIESGRGIWWIDNKAKLAEIQTHIDECLQATRVELSKLATDFRNLCFQHIHVIKSLPDVVSIEEFSPITASSGNLSYHYKASATLAITFSFKPATSTKLGDSNIQGLVGFYEPAPSLPSNIKVDGKGYRLKLPEPDANGTVQYTVTFPKYPYPAIKPEPTK
jgi:hypothetical protein